MQKDGENDKDNENAFEKKLKNEDVLPQETNQKGYSKNVPENEPQEEIKLHISVPSNSRQRKNHQMKLVVGNTEWTQQLFLQQGKNRL